MSRSPFAYPLKRNIDSDAGGAAELQTDIMRFMAILALCLMAIFALVQSMPLAPVAAPQSAQAPAPTPREEPAPDPAPEAVVLTRPQPRPVMQSPPAAERVPEQVPEKIPEQAPEQVSEQEGFTLRFESNIALMRLVATSQVGLYALGQQRAQRMTVSASRISFWDASTPNAFHEMEAATVPGSVVDALVRSGTPADTVSWGVTLPGKLREQLDELMRSSEGGSLLISADGQLRLEAT